MAILPFAVGDGTLHAGWINRHRERIHASIRGNRRRAACWKTPAKSRAFPDFVRASDTVRAAVRCHTVTPLLPRIGHVPGPDFGLCHTTARWRAGPGSKVGIGRRAVMRAYIAVVLTIIGLLGAYVALLPLAA
jgi:hypothetical protein